MSGKTLPKGFGDSKIAQIHATLSAELPQLYAFLTSGDDFQEMRIYLRPDGSHLGVLKGYGGDGTPVICFGSGLDAVTCFLGIEMTLTASRWRTDKPVEKEGG